MIIICLILKISMFSSHEFSENIEIRSSFYTGERTFKIVPHEIIIFNYQNKWNIVTIEYWGVSKTVYSGYVEKNIVKVIFDYMLKFRDYKSNRFSSGSSTFDIIRKRNNNSSYFLMGINQILKSKYYRHNFIQVCLFFYIPQQF